MIKLLIQADTTMNSLDIPPERKKLKREILEKKQQYGTLLKNIELLKADISNFRELYEKEITPLHERINQLDNLLFKYRNISQYVDDVFTFEEAEKVFDETMKERQERIEAEFKRQYKRKNHVEKRSRLSQNNQEKLKTYYYKLARIFHPDRANGNELMMKQINKAYMDGDLELLQDFDLEYTPENRDETLSGLQQSLLTTKKKIEKAQREIQSLQKSEMYIQKISLQKKHKIHNGSLITNLVHELMSEVTKKEEELKEYLEQFPTESTDEAAFF